LIAWKKNTQELLEHTNKAQYCAFILGWIPEAYSSASKQLLTEMESELREALEEMKDLLEQDPTNEEALQVYSQLQEVMEGLAGAPTEAGEGGGKEGGDEDISAAVAAPGQAEGEGEERDAVAAAMALLDEGDHPSELPEHCGDRSAMYIDRQPTGQDGCGRREPRADNNCHIHPRSVYASVKPDFAALAKHYPGLALRVKVSEDGKASIDFKDSRATKELTRALLHNDHKLDWWIPEGHLIPPLTNRLNYIYWLEDLLTLSKPAGGSTVIGLDIGCGANCIYPLLGASVFGWRFVGTDITDSGVLWAQRNVACNSDVKDLVQVRKVAGTMPGRPAPSGMLLNAMAAEPSGAQPRFHFCMCNPPFFKSMHEAGRNPETAHGGTDHEMVCKGGELVFVKAMVDESMELKEQVHWYTSMLGKKSTLKEIRKYLHELKVPVVRSTHFFQGETSRWAVGWSFAADRNLAVVPLQRAAAVGGAGAGTPAGPPRRFVSFIVKTKARAAVKQVYDAMQDFLASNGVMCRADGVMMKLTGTWADARASKQQKIGGSSSQGIFSIVGFNCLVYEDSPKCMKVTGSLESPTASADDAEAATRAFNVLFRDAESHLNALFSAAG